MSVFDAPFPTADDYADDHQARKTMGELIANIDAENGLIGGLLLDNGAFDRIGDRLKAEHFSTSFLREIFTEITKQIGSGQSCDVVTVGMALDGKVTMQQLNSLAQFVPSAANIRRYADMVIERFKSRALLTVSAEISELAHNHHRTIEDRVDAAQSQLTKLIDEAPKDDWVSAFDGLVQHTQVLEDRNNGKINAWETGLSDLDSYLEGGLRAGELVIIGARPSMGKTALGMTIGLHMAEQHAVGMLSMEMTQSDVRDRMVAMMGNVTLSNVKRPDTGLQWDRVTESVERSRNIRFAVSDQSGLNINQVRSKARAIKRTQGLNVLVVDYIGLMTGLDPKQNRAYQLEEVSRGLKNLAKELGIAVLCLAQLNRGIEARGADAIPQLSDLRDSGAIEQDADIVMFVHRPIQANPELGLEWQNFAKLSIAKNRNGKCGLIYLNYQGNKTKFYGWTGQLPQKSTSSKRGDL